MRLNLVILPGSGSGSEPGSDTGPARAVASPLDMSGDLLAVHHDNGLYQTTVARLGRLGPTANDLNNMRFLHTQNYTARCN